MAMALQQARTSVKTASGLDALVGLWLVLSPFILGYSLLTGALWNAIIVGVLVILLAGMRALGEGYRSAWPSWVNLVLGLWMIVAPFIIGYAGVMAVLWNSIIVGALIVILAAWSALSTPEEQKMS
ncbi:MAG: SPW repeat protein [Candidatus Andersenbacteria bacterium]|nr:SPW repeat protein [Candidatus Andersenbacteria bacterium]